MSTIERTPHLFPPPGCDCSDCAPQEGQGKQMSTIEERARALVQEFPSMDPGGRFTVPKLIAFAKRAELEASIRELENIVVHYERYVYGPFKVFLVNRVAKLRAELSKLENEG